MTTKPVVELPESYLELNIVEGPSLHELQLSHQMCIANHIKHETFWGPNIQNRTIQFTTDTKWGAGGEIVRIYFIISLNPKISDGSTEYPAQKIGLVFEGMTFLSGPINTHTFIRGFYCPRDRTGYIIIPQ